jgi:hypothetical protein
MGKIKKLLTGEALTKPLQAPVSGFSVQVSGRRNIVWFFLTPET